MKRWLALSLLGCSSGPSPSVSVASSRELGVVQQSPLIVGRDGGWGASVFGHEVFTFGDSFVTQPDALNGSSFHSNSFSFTDDLNAADGIGGLQDLLDSAGSPLPLIPATDDEEAYFLAHRSDANNLCQEHPCGARFATWPGAIIAGNGSAFISYGLISAAPGDFNFSGVGSSIAVWSDFSQPAARPNLGYCPDHSTLLFCQKEGDWSGSLVADGDTVYGFDCHNHGFSSDCRVARVPLANPLDRSQWQAWDGHAWVAELTQAATLFEGGLNMRVHYNAYAHSWMAIYSKILSTTVDYRTAPSLTGPWSEEATLFVSHQNDPNASTYDAYVQPDYSEKNGQILYVTFSRSTGTLFGSELALVQVTLH